MNIGIDLRFLDHDTYSHFAFELVKKLIHKNPHIQYNIYTRNADLFDLDSPNLHVHFVDIKPGSFKEQLSVSKYYKRDKNAYMIFFNHLKPLGYK